MKKKHILRKAAALLLAGAMLTGTATAEVVSSRSYETDMQLEQKIIELLLVYYDGQVDEKANISYGSEIPTYVYADDSIRKSESLKFYPVYINSDLSGYIRESIDSGKIYLSYSEEFVSDIIELNADNYNFICSEDNFYAMSNTNIVSLDNNSADEKNEIDSIKHLIDLDVNNVVFYSRLSENNNLCLTSYVASADNITFSLPVPTWSQPSGSGLCWAGSVEAVGEYMTGNMSYSPSLIASRMGIGSGGAYNSDIKKALLDLYAVSTEENTQIPSFSYLTYKISNGKPIIATLQSASSGHNMTIIGYGATASSYYIKVMDTLGGVYRVFQLTNGTFSIRYNIEPFTWTSAVIPN